jgi:uncharacterized protein YndB with AHSA1/START domain
MSGLMIALKPEAEGVRVERVLPGPLERAWAWLTEADKLGQWFAEADGDLGPERRVKLRFRAEVIERPRDYVSEFVVTRWEPNRALGCTWVDPEADEDAASHVLFELEPRGEQVLLVISNTRLPRSDWADVAGGWTGHTAVLLAHLAGRTPPGLLAVCEAAEAGLKARLAA